jgi:sterol O-acyltransferase
LPSAGPFTGSFINVLSQFTFLTGGTFLVCFYRQWFWVQSGFLTLHTLTMIMKVHSYSQYNGFLSEKARELSKAKEALEAEFKKRGGKTVVLHEAATQKARAEQVSSSSKTNGWTSSVDNSNSEGQQEASPRRRASGQYPKRRPSLPAAMQTDVLETLEYHPDETIADLAISIDDLNRILTSKSGKVTWPENVTYWNFIDYLLVPTLVYELEYPRTMTYVPIFFYAVEVFILTTSDSIRPLYVLERTLATFGTFTVILIITEHYIYPSIERLPGQTFLVSWLDLVPPFVLNFLLIFFISTFSDYV